MSCSDKLKQEFLALGHMQSANMFCVARVHFYNILVTLCDEKYCIFSNTLRPRISRAPHFLRSKNIKNLKKREFYEEFRFFFSSNISAHNEQFLNLNALFFVFLPQLQLLLSRFWCPATWKWYALTSRLCCCIIFKLCFVKSKLCEIRLKIIYRYSSLLLSSSSELAWLGSLSHRLVILHAIELVGDATLLKTLLNQSGRNACPCFSNPLTKLLNIWSLEFPIGVNSCSPAAIHRVYCSLSAASNGINTKAQMLVCPPPPPTSWCKWMRMTLFFCE
jgi:hypothetical protein